MQRDREQPSHDLNSKPEVSLTAEEVGVTGCKEGNCACRVLPGRNTAASIASKTLGNTTVGTHNGLSPSEKPRRGLRIPLSEKCVKTLFEAHLHSCACAIKLQLCICHAALVFGDFNTPLV